MGNDGRAPLRRRRRRTPSAARRARAASQPRASSSSSPAWKARCRASSRGSCSVPVIAVPTSVGYGASFGGIAALLGMLNSCASGVSVVNIDNGFGAGQHRQSDQSLVGRSGLIERRACSGRPDICLSSVTCSLTTGTLRLRVPDLRLCSLAALRALEFDRIVEAVRGFALTPDGRRAPGAARARRPTRSRWRSCSPATTETTQLPRQRTALFPLRASSGAAADSRRARHRRTRARSAAAAGARDVSRLGRRGAGRRSAARRDRFRSSRPATAGAASFKRRDRAGPREDRPVGRRRRRREPRAASAFASGCASSGRGCAARSSRTCAARTRRSTCRSRSSPSATAATCSSSGPSTAAAFRASSTARRRAARACFSSRSARSRSTTTSSRSRSRKREEVRRILLALTDAFRARAADLQRTIEAATELDVLQARARFSQSIDGVEPRAVDRRRVRAAGGAASAAQRRRCPVTIKIIPPATVPARSPVRTPAARPSR